MTDKEIKHVGLNLKGLHPEAHENAGVTLFGFWIFLMSDAVLFALLFASYGVMLSGTAGGPAPSDVYEIRSAAIETAILLISSFTFGMASLALKYGKGTARLKFWLMVTLVLGAAFLAMEWHDFAKMISGGAGPSRSGFLSAFFVLVPTHGLHVLSGCIWIVVMLVQLRIMGLDEGVKTRLLRLGLFWHFLDIIWVGIFTVVYLQGLIK